MKDSKENPIDELFRDELSSYTIPVVTTSAAIVAIAAAKKGLLYKFSIFKLNFFYSILITTTTIGGVSVGAIKTYQHIVDTKNVTNTNLPNNNTHLQPNTNSTVFADTINQKQEQINDNSVINSEVKEIEVNQSKTITPLNKQSELPTNQNKPIEKQIVSSPTQEVSPIITKDTVAPAPVIKKMVYVKKQQVVVQDTVIKVVKKKRK